MRKMTNLPKSTPRIKFRLAIQAIGEDSNLQDKANVYSWSTRHLAYKLLKNHGYHYYFRHRWSSSPAAYWYSSESRGKNPMNLTKFATWYRFLYNGYEPSNQIKLIGKLSEDGETYIVFEMWGSLNFNDGHSFVSIHRSENGQFRWRKGDEIGIAASFMDAWNKMPAYVTSPDHWEESPIVHHDRHS